MKNKKLYHILTFLLMALGVVFLQVTFFGHFDRFLSHLNLVLILMMIFVVVFNFGLALSFALTVGFLFDIYSDLPFGLFILSFFITTLVLKVMIANFFTNRSLYPVIALGLMGAILYHLIFFLIGSLYFLLGLTDFNFNFHFWRDLLNQLLGVVIILPLCFILINKNSKIFKPVFLRS